MQSDRPGKIRPRLAHRKGRTPCLITSGVRQTSRATPSFVSWGTSYGTLCGITARHEVVWCVFELFESGPASVIVVTR